MQKKLAAGASVFNYLMYLPDPTKSLSNYLQVVEKSFRSDPVGFYLNTLTTDLGTVRHLRPDQG